MRNMMRINGRIFQCTAVECDIDPRAHSPSFTTKKDAEKAGWISHQDTIWSCPVSSKDDGTATCRVHDKTFPKEGECPDCENLNVPLSMRLHGLGESDPNGVGQHEPGAKLDAGKVQAGVLGQFSRALLAVAEVGTHGAEKYSRGGWQSVENGIERYGDAGWRHKLKGEYEELDPDSELKHKAHEAWNILAELELILRQEGK